MNERRRKLVPVSPDFLYEMFTQGNTIHAKCTRGLPNDARFIGISYDPQRDVYYLCFEAAEWEPVALGLMLPELNVQYTSIHITSLLERAERLFTAQYDQESTRWLEEYRALKDVL